MKSIFKTKQGEEEYYNNYDKTLDLFGVPYTSNYIQTSYGETHVVAFGNSSKKPLVLLHGMTMSSTMWYPNVKQLIEERFVYAIDVMGDFGKSKPIKIIKNKKSAAEWLNEVLTGLKLQTTDIAGHSMGGFLALNYSLLYPKRVSKLILLAPAASFNKMNPLFFMRIYPALLFHTENLIDSAFRWTSEKNEPLDVIIRNQVISGYRHAKPLLRLMPTVFSKAELENHKHPTLLLIGEKEVIYPANKAIAYAKKYISNLEVHNIPGANHMFTVEQAELVNELMCRFLADNSRNIRCEL